MAKSAGRYRAGPKAKLITMAEAAARAANSPAWWRKLAARQQIKVVKLGRSSRLREDEVERILARGYPSAETSGNS